VVRYLDHVEARGEDLFAAVEAMGLEGIVAKRAGSPYRAGYSSDWLKVRIDQTDDFVVVGFEPVPKGSTGLRNLHVAASDEGQLTYAGTVGSGFTVSLANELRALLEPLRRGKPALPLPPVKGAVWVEPKVMVELRFKEKTESGGLRHPVFLRVRDDKTVLDARPPSPLSNLDKVFWPGEGITKGDLIDYYRGIAQWMLPYLAERPVVIDRYPDGIAGKSFFQKNAPDAVAGRVRTVPIETSERTIEAFLVDDVEALLCLVNLGAIPFHVWSSRVGSLDQPDWCILDFDPKGAPFAHVARLARTAHDLCRQAGLPAYVKTSGGSGLHVLLSLGGQLGHEQSRQLAELLAHLIVRRHPDIATTARAIPARGGRVYVDAFQNGRGKLIAAPYAVRPHPGAPVSTPLAWKEVKEDLVVEDLNLKTLPERLERLRKDPLRPVLSEKPDLAAALAKLAAG
jgi:bifunctional non-homologous end joining protein LigD